MEQRADFDNNKRRREILTKYTIFVFIGYSISQIVTLIAHLFHFSSVSYSEILFATSTVLGATIFFLIIIRLKKTITASFVNFTFFGQFAVWLVMYTIWFFTLREIRVMALFFALMALVFLLASSRFIQSMVIAISATIIQMVGSYYAIFHLGQRGSFGLEIFFTFCFLPSAVFIAYLSENYSRQRNELKEARRTAERNHDALLVEMEKANKLNVELQKALVMIEDMAIHDELTGLYNRRHLMELLEIEKKRADRNGQLFSLVMLDIDHFKKVNDTLGHLVGDQVLRVVAHKSQGTLRATDFCGRYGGEEFVIVMGQTTRDGAHVCAERVRSLVELTQFPELGNDFQVTISLGITEYQLREDLSNTISRADKALYLAKNAGRNRVESVIQAG
jgi:diguanylate cyclase (GGDEF)-like protein